MPGRTFAGASSLRGALHRWGAPTTETVVYAGVVAALTVLAIGVWWAADLLPLQDYPQFLVFVRAVRDMNTATSPFHGTYTVAPWFTPTGLPVHLTSLLATVSGGSVERGGRLLLSLQGLGLVGSSTFLLRTIGASRWNIVLLFPLLHSYWTIGGFTAFATGLPLVVLGAAVAIRWFRSGSTAAGIGMAVLLSATLFWHGIAFMMSGLTVGVLWFTYRFPSWGARLKAAAPSAMAAAHYALWTRTTFSPDAHPSPPEWQLPWDAADLFLTFVSPPVPHPGARAPPPSPPRSRGFHRGRFPWAAGRPELSGRKSLPVRRPCARSCVLLAPHQRGGGRGAFKPLSLSRGALLGLRVASSSSPRRARSLRCSPGVVRALGRHGYVGALPSIRCCNAWRFAPDGSD